ITQRRAEDKGLQFIFDAASDIPVRLHGDEIRVRQVMLNVINNAVKYTEKGGVTVNVSRDEAEADGTEQPDMVTLTVSVKDTGAGIREEDLNKLFQPFDRLEETKNRNIEGTGLGLSIANQYIRLMDGHIDVESVYGEGSVFTLYIPLQVVDSTPIGDFTAAIRAHKEKGEDYRPVIIAPNARVLVVDDNEMNLEVISGLMESTQIKVDTALSGPEGIDMMDSRRYDLVFLDQMMPGMDGINTLQIMRSKYDMRGVSVIALTADAVAGAREFYLEKGFDDYLSKPVKSEALEKMLIKHLPSRLLLTPEDIERISRAEEQRRLERDRLDTIVVVNSDSEALKAAKGKLNGIYKGTFVTDLVKAGKFLEKHDAEYVMMSRSLFTGMKTDGVGEDNG
ncbi:MAG: response regulator, partial [Lachnospiraceae bacterium]|nr:response regulator [Lachnospiraceae bacterium]